MSLTQDAAADRRWAAAAAIAGGGMDDRMPIRRRTVWLWLAAAMVGVLVVPIVLGLVLGAVLPRSSGHSAGERDETWGIVGLSIQAVGFLVMITGLVWAKRTHRFIARWRAVASPLVPKERRWVVRQMRSQSPVDDVGKQSVVLALAAQLRSTTEWYVPFFAGIMLNFIGVAVSSPWAFVRWVLLILVPVLIVMFGLLARDYRRAGTYIDTFGGLPRAGGSADSSGGTAG